MFRSFVLSLFLCQSLGAMCCSANKVEEIVHHSNKLLTAGELIGALENCHLSMIDAIIEKGLNHEKFISLIRPFVYNNLCRSEKIVAIFLKMPHDRRKRFCNFLLSFLIPNEDASNIIQVANSICPEDYAHYQKIIFSLYKMYFLTNATKLKCVEKILKLPIKKLTPNFIEFVKDITPLFYRELIPHAIDLAEKHQAQDYPILKKSYKELSNDVPKNNHNQIFRVLEFVPLQELSAFIGVVNTFYSIAKDYKIYIIEKLSFYMSLNQKTCYNRCLNIDQNKFDMLNKLSSLLTIHRLFSCLEVMSEFNFTTDFYIMVKKMTRGLEQDKILNFIKSVKDIDIACIKEEHYQILKESNSPDEFRGPMLNYIIKLSKEQLTTPFVKTLKKYSKSYDYETMLASLTYDEMLRIPSLQVPDFFNTAGFFRSAKYMLLQETPIIDLERYIEFYQIIYNSNRISSFNIIKPNLQLLFIDYCLGHPSLFSYVPGFILFESLKNVENSNELLEIFNTLRRDYYVPHQERRQNYASEIHSYAGQLVLTENMTRLNFNNAVINYISGKISLERPTFQNIKHLLRHIFNETLMGPLKQDSLTEETFTWCMDRILKEEEETFITTYLYVVESIGDAALPIWLQAFIDESINAYGAQKGSCIRGIQERVVTSLRAVPIMDEILLNYFQQAETAFTHRVKAHQLSDYNFWAKILQENGCTPLQDENEIKPIYQKQLEQYFAPLNANARMIISSALEVFEDSVKGKNDGVWSKIKAAWPDMETDTDGDKLE